MWFKSSSYVNNLFRLCASLWNQLLKLLLSICFTCFQAIIIIQLRTLHFCKRTTECLSLVKSQHVYILHFCGVACEYSVYSRLFWRIKQKRRSRHQNLRRSSSKAADREGLDPSRLPVVIDGSSTGVYFCSAAVYSLLALRGSISCKLDHKVKTLFVIQITRLCY